ncbi:MAG: ATP-binding cassette domain-containing protein [Deltaproteobacteria bacterium]|nr:ATP-binding cassette domain-containing protein [Deltaproteobacteria bacterium]MBT5834140.1 ATP-binding cassette domain-containing protein [Deltaproteobacteria bacterium]
MLSLKNVSNQLWDKQILKDIFWSAEFGQSWAILGPNGSGKSTLIKIILGQVPYCGTIKRHQEIEDFGKIAHVSLEQQKLLVAQEEKKDRYEEYSGNEEHFLTGQEVMDPEGNHPESLLKIAKQLGLSSLLGNPLRSFSNGETRKTLIGKALLSEPKLLILDEPFEGLDTESVLWLKGALSDLIKNGLAVWLVSHRFEELVPEITHVLCLKSGEIFAQGLRSQVLITEVMEGLYEKVDHKETNLKTNVNSTEINRTPISTDFFESVPEKDRKHSLIRMRNVNVHYGEKVVLKKFFWSVEQGENWKIVGPNGSGKSTLLSLICGDNLQAYANEIYLFGRRRGTGESIWDIKQKIGFVSSEFQVRYRQPVNALKVVLSGFFDSIGYYQPASVPQKERALSLMELLEITNLTDLDFTRLSYGQQRLILIARAMIKSPPLLILDEPCQGLDRTNRKRVLELVDLVGKNTTTQILYVTHSADDHLNCLQRELCFEATPEGVFHPIVT